MAWMSSADAPVALVWHDPVHELGQQDSNHYRELIHRNQLASHLCGRDFAIYMGERFDASPMAMPPAIRQATNV